MRAKKLRTKVVGLVAGSYGCRRSTYSVGY